MKKRLRRTYRVAKYVVYRQTLLEPEDHFWTFIGAFLGIALIGLVQKAHVAELDQIFLIGSFGASAVLVFGAANSPLAQPRNLILGHSLSALIGVTVYKLVPSELWLSSALAVSLSIVVMQITRSMHPPGGATALIASVGSDKVKSLGYGYVVSPVMSGVAILFVVALVVNNLPRHRHYPARWKARVPVRRKAFTPRHDLVPHSVAHEKPVERGEPVEHMPGTVAGNPWEKSPRTALLHHHARSVPQPHAPAHPHKHVLPHAHQVIRTPDHGADHRRHHRHDRHDQDIHTAEPAPGDARNEREHDERNARALPNPPTGRATIRPSARKAGTDVPERADDKAA